LNPIALLECAETDFEEHRSERLMGGKKIVIYSRKAKMRLKRKRYV